MRTQRQTVMLAMAATVLGAMAGSANAAIVNGGFEDGLTGWSWVAYGWNTGVNADAPVVSEGSKALNLSYGGIEYQDVGPLEPNTTYTLTAAVCANYYGSSISNLALIGVTGPVTDASVLAAIDAPHTGLLAPGAISVPGLGQWTTSYSDYITGFTTGDVVSGDLVVAIVNQPTASGYADNVRLETAAVPEPASLLSAGVMGLMLLGGRRRRMA